jgi:hypothetical protein
VAHAGQGWRQAGGGGWPAAPLPATPTAFAHPLRQPGCVHAAAAAGTSCKLRWSTVPAPCPALPSPGPQVNAAAAVEAPAAASVDWASVAAQLDTKSPLEIMDHVRAALSSCAALFLLRCALSLLRCSVVVAAGHEVCCRAAVPRSQPAAGRPVELPRARVPTGPGQPVLRHQRTACCRGVEAGVTAPSSQVSCAPSLRCPTVCPAAPLSTLLPQALATFGTEIAIAFSGAEDVALIEYAHLTGRPFRVFRCGDGAEHFVQGRQLRRERCTVCCRCRSARRRAWGTAMGGCRAAFDFVRPPFQPPQLPLHTLHPLGLSHAPSPDPGTDCHAHPSDLPAAWTPGA